MNYNTYILLAILMVLGYLAFNLRSLLLGIAYILLMIYYHQRYMHSKDSRDHARVQVYTEALDKLIG